MTYRERYQQLHPNEDVSEGNLDFCPDARMHDLSDFCCPAPTGVDVPDVCRDCWDREIPGTEAEPPKSEPESSVPEPVPTPEKPVNGEATARVLAEVVDDVIHMSADGDVHDLILCALGAVHITAKNIYDQAEDKLAAEKLIHEMQNALRPTGKIWCFDDKETG